MNVSINFKCGPIRKLPITNHWLMNKIYGHVNNKQKRNKRCEPKTFLSINFIVSRQPYSRVGSLIFGVARPHTPGSVVSIAVQHICKPIPTGCSKCTSFSVNPLNPELNPICYLLALLGAHHFLHVSRIRVKLLTFRLLMSYIDIWSIHS